MASFFIVGESSGNAEPIERVAASACEAEKAYFHLLRICGSKTRVRVLDVIGRKISLYTLTASAVRERETAASSRSRPTLERHSL